MQLKHATRVSFGFDYKEQEIEKLTAFYFLKIQLLNYPIVAIMRATGKIFKDKTINVGGLWIYGVNVLGFYIAISHTHKLTGGF